MRLLLLTVAFLASASAAEEKGAGEAALIEAGRGIYEHGVLPSGEPLTGTRLGGAAVSGRGAACVQCHQRSGMGLSEGAALVPPITAPALFRNESPVGAVPRRAPGMQFQDYPFKTRPPYDGAGLARAIREGVSPTGHRFQYMMPRYALAEADMGALIAYLRTLSELPSPGADDSVAHFATVVAPGIDPARREAHVGVLKACFAERYPEAGQDASGMADAGKRQVWRLHVWDLEGAPETWESQLQEKYASQPVFAVVSGLGADEWSPVERFCEANRLPCLFPNVEVPGSFAAGRYSFYFFRGVALEAAALASYLGDQREKLGISRVVQITGPQGSGVRGAAALREALAGTGIEVEQRVLVPGSAEAKTLSGIRRTDAVVLWLREGELSKLVERVGAPPAAGLLLMSGMLGGLENAPLTPSWRKTVQMVYPFDPPGRWHLRMDRNLRPWLTQHHLPRVDERLQGNTLSACNLLFESMLRLRGYYFRDYLVEWIENYPTAMGNAPAPQAFPRFSLGPGQRFSSKGAYIVRFSRPESKRIEPVQDWIVP